MITFEFTLSYLEIYLIVISFLSFSLYAYDKFKAFDTSSNPKRVSELKLLSSSLLGGTLGSVLGMLLFRHKIKKRSFLMKFLLVIFIQASLIYIYINYSN